MSENDKPASAGTVLCGERNPDEHARPCTLRREHNGNHQFFDDKAGYSESWQRVTPIAEGTVNMAVTWARGTQMGEVLIAALRAEKARADKAEAEVERLKKEGQLVIKLLKQNVTHETVIRELERALEEG